MAFISKLSFKDIAATTIRLSAGLVGLIALLVMWGWLTHNGVLVHVRPNYAPMKFNTAICLLLSSIAMLALELNSRRLTQAFSLSVTLITLATLAEYVGINLGIDEFMMPLSGDGGVLHPGRMAPNTALALILANAAVFCLVLSRTKKSATYLEALSAVMGSAVIALGAVTLIAYISGIESARTWGLYSGMAIHTAFSCVLLGGSVVAAAWKRAAGVPPWMPIPVSIGFLIIAISTYQAVLNYEDMQFQKDIQAEANYLAGRGNDRLTAFYAAVDRISNRWVMAGHTPQKLWEGDAQSYIKAYPFLVALEWIDPQSRLQWIASQNGDRSLVGQKLNTEGVRLEVAQRAIATRASQVTPSVSLFQGGKGFLYMSPLFVRDRFDGFIVAAYRLDEMFQKILSYDKTNSYYLVVQENGQTIFSNMPVEASFDPQWKKTTQLNNKGNVWTLTVGPTPAGLAARGSYLPTLILIMGGLAALFGTLASILANKWRREGEQLYETREQFRLALEHAPIGMALVAPDGKWLRVNQGICDLVGYRADELMQMDFQSITHPDDLEADLKYVWQMLKGAIQTYQLEKRYIHKNGQTIYASLNVSLVRNENGFPKYFISQIQDITMRRMAEMEQAKLLGIIEESSDFIGTADLDGNLLYHNRGAKRMIGLPDDFDITKLKISDMHPAWASRRVKEEGVPAVMEKGVWVGENALLHRDGHEIPVSQALSLLRDKEGHPVSLTTIMRDISEIKKVERMKSEFISIVSHELRTPLTSIRGALGLLAAGKAGDLPQKASDLIQIAHKNGERLVRIINDILDIEKLESGKMEMRISSIEIMPFLRNVLDANHAYGEKYDVKFVVKGERVAKNVLADADRLMQVFANLLSNAAKYSPPGGEVHVSVKRRDHMVRFHVQDFGGGIPAEFRSRIFQKFAQADSIDTRRHDGTGLGLSITRKFVEAMEGRIDFVSEIGAGTTFYFDLPLDPASQDMPDHVPPHVLATADKDQLQKGATS